MNPFTAKALLAGQAFAVAHPDATNVDIDKASPKFNPSRRAFQDGAHSILGRRLAFAIMTKDALYHQLEDACSAKDYKKVDLVARELVSRL